MIQQADVNEITRYFLPDSSPFFLFLALVRELSETASVLVLKAVVLLLLKEQLERRTACLKYENILNNTFLLWGLYFYQPLSVKLR